MAVEGATPAERLAKQRRSLRKRLGMGGRLDELMETDKLIKDEDLLLAEGPTSKKGKDSTEAAELLTNMEGAASCLLDCEACTCSTLDAHLMGRCRDAAT